jgi:hypothetical protein
MKRLVTRAGLLLNRLRLAGALQVITCVIGVRRDRRAGSTLQSNCRRHHSRLHRRANSAVDALIRLHEQRRTRSQFDYHPEYASDDFSKHPFGAACETAFPVSVPGIAFEQKRSRVPEGGLAMNNTGLSKQIEITPILG